MECHSSSSFLHCLPSMPTYIAKSVKHVNTLYQATAHLKSHLYYCHCHTTLCGPLCDCLVHKHVPQTMALTAIHSLYKNHALIIRKTKSLQWKQRRYSRPPLISMQLMASNSWRQMEPRDRSSALISSESPQSNKLSGTRLQLWYC